MRAPRWRKDSQGGVRQVLNDFGRQGERTQGARLWVRLRQTEEGRAQDRRTEEPEEEGSGDETLANLWSPLVFTELPPAGEDLVQLFRKRSESRNNASATLGTLKG